jgi:hypothetical protein
MKGNFLLLLSVNFIAIAGIEASDDRGETLFEKHSPHTSHAKVSNTPHNLSEDKNFISEIAKRYNTKDPYDLEEISVQKLSNKHVNEAASVLVAAAAYGHNDIQAFLADIDYSSLKYLDSKAPQSNESIRYYKNTLIPKVEEHFARQLKDSSNHHNITVNTPKNEKSLTFDSIK